MNYELLDLIRSTGYLSDAPLSDAQRFDLITAAAWKRAVEMGYDVVELKRILWRLTGHKEHKLIAALPDAPIQKAVKRIKQQDPRQQIKETAALIVLLYQKGEKEIRRAIDNNIDQPDAMRTETGRIRRALLMQAASWLGQAIPGLYVAGSKAPLQGPHAKAAEAMAAQEFNRFKEVDAQLGRHIEGVIAESELRRTKAALSSTKPNYGGLKGKVVGYKTIEGNELGLADYIKMAALTAARNVFNLGVENSMTERGEDLALISREVRINTCAACRDWAGKIVSLSGNSKDYPPLKSAIDAGLMHPHCIHYLIPVDYPGST
jgi:hypothetical protein